MIHLNIGSNLNSNFGNKFDNISIAIKLLIENKFDVKRISNFYETPSYPNKNLPNFLNVGIFGTFRKEAKELRNIISLIEKKIGRVKTKKNNPRVCDIDIIDYKGLCLEESFKNQKIVTPHPRMHLRNFVIFPLYEVNKTWIHPKTRTNINVIINQFSNLDFSDIRIV